MLIYGIHAVSAAIDRGFDIKRIYMSNQGDMKRREEVARRCTGKKGPNIERLKDKKSYEKRLEQLGLKRNEIDQTQGIVAELREFPYRTLIEVLGDCKDEVRPILLVLDSVTDPQNLGAIIRSAAFFGVKGVLLPDRRSAPVTATTIKISAGSFTEVSVVQVGNLVNALKELKNAGFWIYGLSEHAKENLTALEFSGPTALVIGNEEKGIRDLILKTCDFRAHLPAKGGFKSLNSATAAAVSLSVVSFSKMKFENGP